MIVPELSLRLVAASDSVLKRPPAGGKTRLGLDTPTAVLVIAVLDGKRRVLLLLLLSLFLLWLFLACDLSVISDTGTPEMVAL